MRLIVMDQQAFGKDVLERLSAAGVSIVTTKMVVFEWLGNAGTAAFKELSPIIKQHTHGERHEHP
jgi:hypothetical protein